MVVIGGQAFYIQHLHEVIKSHRKKNIRLKLFPTRVIGGINKQILMLFRRDSITVEVIREVKIEDVQRFYDEQFGNLCGEVAIIGDFDA